jgi:hypothetical protein
VTVTIASSDVQNFNLQAQITQVQAAVTANANPAQLQQNTILLDTLQRQLVDNLMASAFNRTPGGGNAGSGKPSFLTASGILSSLTVNT